MSEFDEVIGYEEIKTELNYVLDIIHNPDKYDKLGVKMPNGILLTGDPGVGKTLMAECFIKSSQIKCLTIRKDKPSDDFINDIKAKFEEAKANQPSIVFLDDMDKFANEDSFHKDAEEYVTVQACIDQAKGTNVFILATTNNLDKLPESLLRPGRFDKILEVNPPKIKDATKIIQHYLSKIKYVDDIDCEFIAKLMSGKSCADLEVLINAAGVYAGFEGKSKIDMDDIIKACMRDIFNAPASIDCSYDELAETAYHEAGHAVVAEILEPNSVNIVSVLRHESNVGGVTSYYQSDSYFRKISLMENRVKSLLAGKAATEIVYGEIDTGASSDIRRAFDIVTRFIDMYCSTSFDRHSSKYSSSALKDRQEMQVSSEMERYYQEAKMLLAQNRDFLDKLAKELVDKKTLIAKDIKRIKETCKIVKGN